MEELFKDPNDNSKELEAIRKEMESLKGKVDQQSKASEEIESNWKKEREALEANLNRYKKDAEAAYAFDKLVNTDPDKAVEAIYEHKRKKSKVEEAKATPGGKTVEEIEQLKKELAEQREYLKKKEESETVTEFQNNLYDAIEFLKSNGVEQADPKEILKYMESKGLKDPVHVELAAKTLYSEPLMEARIKSTKKKSKATEAVVMGTQGFNLEEEDGDEPTVTPESAGRQLKVAGPRGENANVDDRLWKSLDAAVFGKK